ncbi:MAG: MFS transporter [Culicoidibacterales bacterium]
MSKIEVVKDARPFGWRDKVGYALGDFGCNLSFVLVSSFFMVYYVTVVGISPVHFGILILLTKVWDGINDPLVGSIVDKIKPGKNGKFKPFIFWGSIMLVAAGVIMFVPISSASYSVKLLICTISYVTWDMCYTIVNVPYGAMSSVMATDSLERTELSKYRAIGGLLGNVPAGVILPMFLYNTVTGDPIGGRFFWTAIILGLFAWVCLQGTIKMCTERIVHVEEESDAENQERKPHFFVTFGRSLKTRPMLGLILASSALLMFLQSNNTTNQYVYMLYYNRTDLIGLNMLISYVPQLLMIVFLTKLVKRFGKKWLSSYPFIGSIAVALFMLFTPVSNPYVWIICQLLLGILQAAFVMLVWALISDCIDFMEAETGNREEGSVYSIITLFRKISSGFGASIIGFGLAMTGYVQTLKVAEQAVIVGQNVKNFAAIFVLIGAVLIFIAMKFVYNLDDKKMEEVEAKLGRASAKDVKVSLEDIV